MTEAEIAEMAADPNAWIKIPEFGVQPEDVNFEGFDYPVFGTSMDRITALQLAILIGRARTLAKRDFKTLARLHPNISEWDPIASWNAPSTKPKPKPQQGGLINSTYFKEPYDAAALYLACMEEIALVCCIAATPKDQHYALGFVAISLTTWAMDGAEEAAKLMGGKRSLLRKLLRQRGKALKQKKSSSAT